MKTIETFIKEIEGSAALQDELKAIKDRYALERFLKKHDCGASVEAFAKYMQPQNEGVIDDDEKLEKVAGGVPMFL